MRECKRCLPAPFPEKFGLKVQKKEAATSSRANVLGEAILTTAMLDRLLHHSEIILIRGDDYRFLKKRKEGLLTSSMAVGTD